jgi:hypothetical protein
MPQRPRRRRQEPGAEKGAEVSLLQALAIKRSSGLEDDEEVVALYAVEIVPVFLWQVSSLAQSLS